MTGDDRNDSAKRENNLRYNVQDNSTVTLSVVKIRAYVLQNNSVGNLWKNGSKMTVQNNTFHYNEYILSCWVHSQLIL